MDFMVMDLYNLASPWSPLFFLTAFLIDYLHHICILVTNPIKFSKYLDSLLKNETTILDTASESGLLIRIVFWPVFLICFLSPTSSKYRW